MRTATMLIWSGISFLLLLGSIVVMVVLDPHVDFASIVLTAIGLTVVCLGPAAIGGFLAFWGRRSSDVDETTYRSRIYRIFVVTEVAGGTALGVSVVTIPQLRFFPLIVVAAAGVLDVIAARTSQAAHARAELRAPSVVNADLPPLRIRRRVLTIVIVFVATLVLAQTLAFVLFSIADNGVPLGWIATEPLGIACIAAALANGISRIRMSPIVRAASGGDLGTARRFGRAVQGKGDPLSNEELPAAARWASVAYVYVLFQIVGTALLYVGLVLNLLNTVGEAFRAVSGWMALGLIVLYLALLPVTVRSVVRLRRFARAHEAMPMNTAASAEPSAE